MVFFLLDELLKRLSFGSDITEKNDDGREELPYKQAFLLAFFGGVGGWGVFV